ncbi:sulfuric ester hydrolase [Aureococcus anophagefferens]|uniref:Sulfuric ester hydrolase n=1 Tax=Aureococcus anophagefferens TaxID=44056 RepID=A0ABR1FGX6_AURAN
MDHGPWLPNATWIAGLGALLLLPAWGAPPPNLLFILLDDFGWNDAGYHNGGRPNEGWTSTPTLDRLAASGVKLESYYTAPICSPSRAQIMTGRYQIRVGIQHGCYGARRRARACRSTRDAVAKLAARDDARPLFVYLAFHMVHESDGAPRAARASVASPDKPTKLLEAPEAYTAKFKDAGLNATRQTFLGMVALVDDAVGNKHELWEGGVRVPAFVFGAGVPSRRARAAQRRRAVDWWPTLVKLAGGSSSADASLDGVDLWPAVARATTCARSLLHNFDTSSKPTAGFRGALRVGDLKLVLLEKHKQTLLYNVTADPREAADLAARRPGDAAALLAKLEAYGAAAVPCWGGTGPTPNPANFSGDCDAHPARSCETPAVYAPGWCG